jgi:hypothetical protein
LTRAALASALLALAFASGAAAARDLPAPPPTDQQSYDTAVGCKIHLEVMEGLTERKRDRKRVAQVLAYWTSQERHWGGKLGKNTGTILFDEIQAGLKASSDPEAVIRAGLCLRLGLVALSLRR